MLHLIGTTEAFVSLLAKSSADPLGPHSTSQTPQFRTDGVDFEGRDKPSGLSLGSPVPSRESAYPAAAVS